MKQKKIILLFFVFAFIISLFSCKKEKFNINQNPNEATDSTIAYNVILPAAQNSTARVVSRSWGWLQNYLGYWARSGTYAPNTEEETYEITTNFQSGIWSSMYDNLYDYQTMQIGANKAHADFYEGIARIMKAHNFAILVDLYNNIPYTEALKGAAITTPKYDKGIDIYKDLLRQVDTGISLITNADESETGPNASIATDDIMFGNKLFPATAVSDMKTRWAQFGNTLKLRILTKFMNGGIEINSTNTVGTVATYALSRGELDQEFTDINNEGSGFLDFNAEVQPGYQADKGNPFFNSYVADDAGSATGNSVYYKANSYAVGQGVQGDNGYYGYNGDLRRNKFYKAPTSGDYTGVYRGVDYGIPAQTINAAGNLAGIGVGVYRGVDQPQWILTSAESYFLQAECSHRGFNVGAVSADQLLASGIVASFTSLGLTTPNANTYIVNNAGYPDVDYFSPEYDPGNGFPVQGGLFTIITQKWFALNAIAPFEVWSDYRRVDFNATTNHFVYGLSVGFSAGPAISTNPANVRSVLPKRLLYPQNEYLYNPTNVSSQGSQGAYPFSSIFWDLN